MKIRNSLLRVSAAVAASTALLVGGTVAMAPTASAASMPKACDYVWQVPDYMKTTTAVNLRKGPGTKYASRGILAKGVRFTAHCNTDDFRWTYGKVTSGAHKGKWGWVSLDYLKY